MAKPVALVTGGARGIGMATAKLFLENEYEVIILDRDEPALVEAAAELGATAYLYDVSILENSANVAEQIRAEFGRLDALVNNAGVADFGPIEECGEQLWRKIMDTNLDGLFYLSQALTPLLKESQGAIVNIASISGLRASTLRVAYGTSKAAVAHLTKQQACELGEYGIRANCVAPGPVKTKLSVAVHSPEIIKAYHDSIPLNRYGSERELAEVIYFLCSPKASFVSGQVIAVDGGFEATGVGLPALRV
ncbi:MAG: SDR family oxidoreductase [Oceanospirillaceae bacterium]|nr:SDR family oxidoreductase [Oceanospirillaceae bacterium]